MWKTAGTYFLVFTSRIFFFTGRSSMVSGESSQCSEYHSKASSDIGFFNQNLKLCGYERVTVISETRNESSVVDYVIKHLTDSGTVINHHDLNDQDVMSIPDILNNSYLDLGITDFLIVVENPDEVMEQAEVLYRQEERGPKAAMPHRTKWAIIWTDTSMNETSTDSLKKYPFDNICLISNAQKSNEKGPTFNFVQTLMWRVNRTREFQKLYFDNISKDTCLIFPNMNYGFNGRNLEMLTKFFLIEELIKLPTEGDSNYSGLWYDVMEDIAMSLNFTFTIVTMNSSFSWDDYRGVVLRENTDVGLSLWNLKDTQGSLASTFPVLPRISTKGMYRMQRDERIIMNQRFFRFLLPFPLGTLYPLTGSFFAVPLLMIAVAKWHSMKNFCLTFSFQKRSVWFACQKFLSSYGLALGQACVSFLRQPISSLPASTPGIILFWFWSLTTLIYYALYTGLLTSDMVQREHIPSLQTYSEMVNGDYRWGTFPEAEIIPILAEAPNGSLLKELYQDIKMVGKGEEDRQLAKEANLFMSERNSVFLHDESILKIIKKHSGCPNDLILMEEELFASGLGYVLPLHSELTDILSRQILYLHDSGVIGKIQMDYFSTDVVPTQTNLNESESVVMTDFLSVALVTFLCFLLSSLVLLIEIVVVRVRSRIKDSEVLTKL